MSSLSRQRARIAERMDAQIKADPFAYAAERTERGSLIAAASLLKVHAPDEPGVSGFLASIEHLIAPHPALSKEDYHG